MSSTVADVDRVMRERAKAARGHGTGFRQLARQLVDAPAIDGRSAALELKVFAATQGAAAAKAAEELIALWAVRRALADRAAQSA